MARIEGKMTNKKRESWGSTRKLKSGRFQARWTHDGMKYKAPMTFSTITDAKKFLSITRADIEKGTWKKRDDGEKSFESFAERFIEVHVRNIKKTTASQYRSDLRVHVLPAFGKRPLNSIRAIDVSEWISTLHKKGRRVGTLRRAHVIMSLIMTEAVRSGIIDSNPCAFTQFPRRERYEPKILQPEEVDEIALAMPPRFKTMVYVLAYCGLRWGEMAALRRGRIDFENREINIFEAVSEAAGEVIWGETKTYERRSVSIPEFLAEMLKVHLSEYVENQNEEALVFTNFKGGWLQNNNFSNRIWRPIISQLVEDGRIREKLSPKDLRATHASWVAASAGIIEAARRLGHSTTATTTKHYARPIAGRDLAVSRQLDELHAKGRTLIGMAS